MILLRRLALTQYKTISQVDLTLPERGSFLIEGLNEAGKSTLFDGIHFGLYGAPLVGDLAEAVQYGAEQAVAEVELSVGGTHLRTKRRLHVGGKTPRADAELWVTRGGDTEYVRGVRPVAVRLVDELGGLTATALLNSCFVAQKQLGRLETLARHSREEALMVLLNLSKLTDVQGSLRVTREADEALRRAGLRLQLARKNGELAALEGKLHELQRRHALGQLREAVETIERLRDARDRLTAERAQVGRALAAVRHELVQIASLAEQRRRWEAQLPLLERLRATAEARAALDSQLEEAAAARCALPDRRRARDAARGELNELDSLVLFRQRRASLEERVVGLAARRAERVRLAGRRDDLIATLAAQTEERSALERAVHAGRRQLAVLPAVEATVEALRQAMRRRAELTEIARREDVLHQEVAAREAAGAELRRLEEELTCAERQVADEEQQRRDAARRERLSLAGERVTTWLRLAQQRDELAAARLLLGELALGVRSVRIVPAADGTPAALQVELVLDHPVVSPTVVCLQIGDGAATVISSRPAGDDLPLLQKGGAAALWGRNGAAQQVERELAAAARAIRETGVRPPQTAAGAERIAAAIAAEVADLAGAAPAEEATFQALVGRAQSLRDQITALRAQAERHDADAALAACVRERQAGRAALRKLLLTVTTGTAHIFAEEVTGWAEASHTGAPDSRSWWGFALAASSALNRYLADPGGDGGDGPSAEQLDLIRTAAADRVRRLSAVEAELRQQTFRLRQLQTDRARGERELAEIERALSSATEESLAQQEAALAAEQARLEAEGEQLWARHAQLEHAPDDAVRDARDGASARLADLEREVAVLESQSERESELRARLDEAAMAERAAAEELAASLASLGHSALRTRPERVPHSVLAVASAPGDPSLITHHSALVVVQERLDELECALAAGREDHWRAREHDLLQQFGELAQALTRGQEDAEAATAQAAAAAARLRLSLPCPDDVWELPTLAPEACPELAGAPETPRVVEPELRQVDREHAGCERVVAELRALLGGEPPLPVAEAEAAAHALELDRKARLKALDVLSLVKRRMVEKVLPSTVDNTCVLLPLLTAGRYRHAELTAEYQLRVWDERKRGYVEKGLFSGGTQDQFSLGLRLGFALAALPRELGTSPGFLFLDEPLSSFDRDRAAALVELVTRGQIALYFNQVILISHSQAFQPELFTHHIEMEDGRVARSTLPVVSGQWSVVSSQEPVVSGQQRASALH